MNLHPIRKRNIHLKNKKPEFKLKVWHKLLFLSPIILIVFIFKINDWYDSYMLHNYKDSTWAIIDKVTLSGVRDMFDTENVSYQYTVNDCTFTSYVSVPVNHRYVIGELDLPLSPQQKYKVYYAKNKPQISKIDLSQPDSTTIQTFIKEVASIIVSIKPNISIEKSLCISKNIYNKFKFDGLAYIYFYDEYIVENFKHNSQTFKSFWNSDEVQSIITKCENNLP